MEQEKGKLSKLIRFIKRLPGAIISALLGALLLMATTPLSVLLIGVV